MEILVLNLGSSSIKFKLFDMKENKPLASGLAEKIGDRNRAVENQIAFAP